MRSDMHKVITERPRSGRCKKSKRNIKKRFYKLMADEEGIVPNSSMRKPYNSPAGHYKVKEFSDLLGPIKKFMRKAAREGRRFDDVYSEIKRTLRGNGTLQTHVFNHFLEQVHFSNRDGVYYNWFSRGRASWPHNLEESSYLGDYEYIVVQSGVLRIHEVKKNYAKKENAPKEIDGRPILKENGVWYWLKEAGHDPFFGAARITLTMISKKDIKKYNLP